MIHNSVESVIRAKKVQEVVSVAATATVTEAVTVMSRREMGAVVVRRGNGPIEGIFTERDLLRRVAVPGRDPKTTPLSEVMTREPESLGPDTLIAYAINRLHNARYRTIPLVDAQGRPIGIMTVNDIVQWLAELFPEAILNAPPGGALKRPGDVDAG